MTKIAKSDKHRHVYLQDQGVILPHSIRIHDGLDSVAKTSDIQGNQTKRYSVLL